MEAGTRRIVVACDDRQGLDGQVSAHFGHCPAYTLVDVGGEEIIADEVVINPYYRGHTPGVIPAFLHELGANVVLSGGMGRRAIELFHQHGIEVSTGVQGSVRAAVDSYLRHGSQAAQPCSGHSSHSCADHES